MKTLGVLHVDQRQFCRLCPTTKTCPVVLRPLFSLGFLHARISSVLNRVAEHKKASGHVATRMNIGFLARCNARKWACPVIYFFRRPDTLWTRSQKTRPRRLPALASRARGETGKGPPMIDLAVALCRSRRQRRRHGQMNSGRQMSGGWDAPTITTGTTKAATREQHQDRRSLVGRTISGTDPGARSPCKHWFFVL